MMKKEMRRNSAVVVLGLMALAATARAQDGAPPTVAATPPAAAARKLHLGLSFLPMANGKFTYADSFDTTATQEAHFAYGVGLSGSYEVLPGLLVGFAPQAIFNVQPKPIEGLSVLAMKEFDFMARVAYAYRVIETISVYAEALPGFSLIVPGDDSAISKGLVLGLGVGCTADMTDRTFVNVGGGYQIGFQNQSEGIHTLALRARYVRVAVGGGVRF
jgi:hypothetical protein